MNALTTTTLDLKEIETPALRKMLADELQLTADSLSRMAAIVKILESRGEDLSDLKSGLAGYVVEIAHGRLAASAVVKFANRRDILRGLLDMPLPRQEALAAGETVQVVTVDRGEFITRTLTIGNLTSGERRRLLTGDGAIRTPAEQRKLLAKRKSPSKPEVVVLAATGELRVGTQVIGRAAVLSALSTMSEQRDTDMTLSGKTTSLAVSQELHDALKEDAHKEGIAIQELVRRIFRAAGY